MSDVLYNSVILQVEG